MIYYRGKNIGLPITVIFSWDWKITSINRDKDLKIEFPGIKIKVDNHFRSWKLGKEKSLLTLIYELMNDFHNSIKNQGILIQVIKKIYKWVPH